MKFVKCDDKNNKNIFYYYDYGQEEEESGYDDFLRIDKTLRKKLKIKRIKKINGIYSILWEYSVLGICFTLIFDDWHGVYLVAEKEKGEKLLDIITEKLSFYNGYSTESHQPKACK